MNYPRELRAALEAAGIQDPREWVTGDGSTIFEVSQKSGVCIEIYPEEGDIVVSCPYFTSEGGEGRTEFLEYPFKDLHRAVKTAVGAAKELGERADEAAQEEVIIHGIQPNGLKQPHPMIREALSQACNIIINSPKNTRFKV